MDPILRNHRDLTGNVGLEEYECSLWEGLPGWFPCEELLVKRGGRGEQPWLFQQIILGSLQRCGAGRKVAEHRVGTGLEGDVLSCVAVLEL